MIAGNFEEHAARFQATANDVPARLKFVTAMRESIEVVHSSEYESFLKHLLPAFLQSLVPPLNATPAELSALPVTQGRCSFFEGDEVHKVRNVILEILHRLPMNEAMKPVAHELLRVVMAVLKADNEENSLICLLIIFDIHKNFSGLPELEKEVQPFIDFFIALYENLLASVHVNFTESFQPGWVVTSTAPPASLPATTPAYPVLAPLPAPSSNPGRALLRGMGSFKVLTESPVIVMLLFQVYTAYTKDNIERLIPHMMKALGAKIPPPPAHIATDLATAAAPGGAVSADVIRWRLMTSDLIAGQTKTLSFLTYVLRGFSAQMLLHSDSLASCVVGLLSVCPIASRNSRKELLVATRHILATAQFRGSFFKEIDRLLEQDGAILVGPGRAHEELRPLAYTALADLVHHMRSDLTLAQLTRVVHIFSCNLADPTLPLSIQIGAVRTMLNLVDHIYRTQETSDGGGRNQLVKILWAIAEKFGTLKDLIPRKIEAYVAKLKKDQAKASELKAQAAQAAATAAALSGAKDATALAAAAATAATAAATAAKGVPTHSTPTSALLPVSVSDESPEDALRDMKALLHTMVVGLKAVVWCITNFRTAQKGAIPFQPYETGIMCHLLENGMQALKIFSPSMPAPVAPGTPPPAPGAPAAQQVTLYIPGNSHGEEKETLDNFASLFMVLDSGTFSHVFTQTIESLFNQIVNDAPKFSLLLIAQQFLSNVGANPSGASQQAGLGLSMGAAGQGSSDRHPSGGGSASGAGTTLGVNRVFAGILLKFLVERMPLMSLPPPESNVSSVLLSLFRLVFASVNENESILRPFINPIVTSALRLASHVKHPLNYFSLLRALFRSIGGGKFEQLYKEFLPLLPELLSGLMRMQSRGTLSVRDISIELCLTVPARLSSLLPYIPILMKAVLLALQAADEQVIKLGLRTLEFWVDNLNPDYLYPHMCPVLNDLMRSLTALLRPAPSPFGHTALNVLGKLGGRNRRFFIEKYSFAHQKNGIEDAWNVDVAWEATVGPDGEPLPPPPPGVTSPLQFSLNLDRTIEMARTLLLKDYPNPYSLQVSQQLQSHPANTLAYTTATGEDGAVPPSASMSSSSPANIMPQKLVQKYNAWLCLRSALVSMLDVKGDFVSFKATLPEIESAPQRADRIKRERAAEEQCDQTAVDEAYSGPTQANAQPLVSVAPTAVNGTTSTPSTLQVLSRPMAPQPSGDAEGAAVAARFQHESTRTLFKSLVQCMVIAASDIYLKKMDVSATATGAQSSASEVEPFLAGLLAHFAMVAVNLPPSQSEQAEQQALHIEAAMMPTPSASSGSSKANLTDEAKLAAAAEERAAAAREAASFAAAPAFEIYHLDLGLFLDALFATLCEENRYWSSAALLALRHFLSSFIALVGAETAAKAPVVAELLARFTHACYEERWELRHGGIVGLSLLVHALPSEWQFAHSGEVIKALLFTFKDEPSAFSELSATRAHSTLSSVVTNCCTLAVDQWERRKKAGFEEAAAAEDGAAAEDADAAMGESTDAPTALDATPAADATTAAPSLVRSESTAETAPSTNTDMDIHMTDGEEAKTTEVKEEKKDAAPAASAAVDATGGKAFDEHKSPLVHALVGHLLYELYASVAAVRDEAHQLLQLMSTTLHRPLATLLAPYRSKLLHPIRQKSLHSFPLAVRIGYISAATYSLSLPSPPMSVRDLKYLVQEVLNDQSEDANYGNHPNTRLLKQSLVTKLRVESIRLMSVLAVESVRLMSSPNTTEDMQRDAKGLRENIIRIFFRSLMSRSSEVVAVAKTGLKAVIDREKLPKDLLQQCLRPVLLNLADYRKLSVILLEGLARLLELLSNCFNVTLGEKLLDHLLCFSSPESINKMRYEAIQAEKAAMQSGNVQAQQQAAANRIRPEDEVKIAACIIDLFHLLPPGQDPPPAVPGAPRVLTTLERLVGYTLALEEMLPMVQIGSGASTTGYPPAVGKEKADEKKADAASSPSIPYTHSTDTRSSSPYRAPLIKFLNVNPYRSCEYFLRSSLLSTKPRQMFLSILKDPSAGPLRRCMAEHPDLIVTWTFKWHETAQQQAAATAAAAGTTAAASTDAAASTTTASATTTSTTAAVTSTSSSAMDTTSSTTTASAPATTSTDASTASTTAPSSTSSSAAAGSTTATGTTSAQSSGTSSSSIAASFTNASASATASSSQSAAALAQESDDRVVQGVTIALILSSFDAGFLTSRTTAGQTILEHLFSVWDSPQRQARILHEETYPSTRLAYLDETRMLVECVLNHVRAHHDQVEVLWRILTVFQMRSLTDFTFLAHFLLTEVALGFTTAEKRHLLSEFLTFFQKADTSEFHKTRAMRFIILPMLKADLRQHETRRPKDLTDSSAVAPPLGADDFTAPFPRSRGITGDSSDRMVDDAPPSPTLSGLSSGSLSSSPLISKTAFDSHDVLDADTVDVIIRKLLIVGSEAAAACDEELRIELLRLATLLLRYLHRELIGYRRELIKFAWYHLKSEHAVSKHWAYVNVCRFIDVYDTPSKIVLQVYVALLRSYQPDHRLLVRKALDVLMPALPKRLPSGEHHKYPTWIKWTKKILIDEGHVMPQLMHIWNLIIRHPDMFYAARTQFVPQMANSLNRLGLPATRALDQRKLAVDLAELIVNWDRRWLREQAAPPPPPTKPRASNTPKFGALDFAADKIDGLDLALDTEQPSKKQRGDGPSTPSAGATASSSTASTTGQEQEFRPAPAMIDLITTFLMRLALTTCEQAETKSLSRRCIRLLRDSMELWQGTPAGDRKFAYIETFLRSPTEPLLRPPADQQMTLLYAATLEVIAILLKYHPPIFIFNSIKSLHRIVAQCLKSSAPTIRDGVCEVLALVMTAYPIQALRLPQEEPLDAFYKEVRRDIREALSNCERQINISMQMSLLGVILKHSPTFMDSHFPIVVRAIQKLARDHLARAPYVKSGSGQSGMSPDDRAKYNLLTDTLRRGLQIIADRIGIVGEHKKSYLSTLAHLIDKSNDMPLLLEITKTITPWITANEIVVAPSPTPLPPSAMPTPAQGATPMDLSSSPSPAPVSVGGVTPVTTSPPLHSMASAPPSPGSILLPKEKANFVLKMCRFDRFDSPELLHRLLDLVLTCFNPSAGKPLEWLSKLQRAFMLGLRCRDHQYRDRFIALFHQHISPTVFDRLNYIFQLQDWENLSDSFWITQATDLLLSILQADAELVPSNAHAKVQVSTATTASTPGRRYNQVVFPSFDSAYWKSSANISQLEAMEKVRLQALAKQRSANSLKEAGGVAPARNDEEDESTEEPHSTRKTQRNRKKRSREQAFAAGADIKKAPVAASPSGPNATVVESSLYTPPSFSSPSAMFAILSTGADDDAALQAVLHAADPNAYRDAFLTHQAQWFYGNAANPLSNLLEPMRDLIHSNSDFTGRVWNAILPQAWAKLTHEQRQELVNPISTLLARDWHSRLPCDRDHLHPVQVLLQSLLQCHPTPAVAPELLRFLARSYSSWHECISMLEQRILYLGPEVPISANIPSYDALGFLYRELGEEDVWHGLWRRRVVSDYSHAALALEQFSMWPRAQDYLYTAMNKKHSGGEIASLDIGPVGRSETICWEEEWVRCSRHLNQWEVLRDFAHQIGHMELTWEAAWRLADWHTLRDMCTKHASADIPNAKLYQISLAIHDRYPPAAVVPAIAGAPGAPAPPPPVPTIHERDIDKLVDTTIQGSLRDWQTYPVFVCNAHLGLLQRFQRIVELNESGQMLTDMAAHGQQGRANMPNFKNFITTWKERLLNKWEELPVWSEILTWRCHMFNIILKTYANGQETDPNFSRIHDLPWTVIKLAQVARKQQLPAVCLQILQRIQQFSRLDVTDMFTRLREQIKTCLQSPVELNASLNILSSTNLEYFNVEQKAEMFRLKGEALQHLGFGDESNTAFSACLSICDSYGKGWASWASFCDRVFTLKKDVQWADHALVCFIQAISSKYKRATLHMSRILYLLSFDWYGGPVVKAFSRFAEHIPLWVWVMWIPQLLSSLARPEGQTVKLLLAKISRGYPQSLYYTMRAYLIEQRDVRPASQEWVPLVQPPAAITAPAAPPAAVEKKEDTASVEKKEDTAMTDVASTSASGTTTAGATTSGEGETKPVPPADAALAGTTQAGFQSGTPGALAKPPATSTPAQPLRGEVPADAAAEALANATVQSSTLAANTAAGSSAPVAPAAPVKSDEQIKKEREEAERSPPPHPNQSILWVEEVCGVLRRSHPSLITEVEKMLEEFSRRFKPEPEEELLNAVHALGLKCFKQPPVPELDAIPTALKETIERVCRRFFAAELRESGAQKKLIAFVQKYKTAFERDFLTTVPMQALVPGAPLPPPVENPHFPRTLTDLIHRLKRWKTHLLYVAGCASNVSLRLEKLSAHLARFQSWDIEVPGQFIHDREPDQMNHVLVQRFDPVVTVHHSHGFSNRRLAMMGDDGRPHHFFVQYQINHITRSDERMMQLYVLLNRLMRNYKETRKRHLVHHVPIVIPLSQRLRLAATDPGHITLEDIYEESCQTRRVDSDRPLFIYRDSLKKPSRPTKPNEAPPTAHESRLAVYAATAAVVPDSILSRFIQRTIPASDQYWCFKQQFCAQLGLSGFLSYLMKVGERHLHRIAVFKQSGRLVNSEFYPTYNDSGLVDSNEPVQFRLTRNLQMALSPTLIGGLFASVLMAANSCLLTNQDVLKNYLSLFLRDDLLSWTSTKAPIETDVRQRELEKTHRDKVTQNTNMVLKRIHMLMPTPHQQPSAAERAAQQAAHAAAGHAGPLNNLANQPQPLNHKIHRLISTATDKNELCKMGPQWAPWF